MNSFTQPPFYLCAQCGAALIAPIWAEHLDERHVRNLGACDACGYQFETSAYFPVRDAEESQSQPLVTSALMH